MSRSRDKRIETPSGEQVIPAAQRAIDNLSVRLANLVPGNAELPDFPIRGEDETPEESRRFKSFVEQNLPRTEFADLRTELDRCARSKATTPVRFYRSLVEGREMLRSAVKIMNWLAGMEDRCPVLRICEGCGLIFAPSRKDKMTCSTTCRDRIRQAKFRYNRDQYKKARYNNDEYKENRDRRKKQRQRKR
ncbi:MAG: hypothetical protein ABSA78_01455 [Candidatus Sulfotelmatobacter sp.]|jgi:hypothetical protein